jgi:hypothetical protein
LSARSWSTVGLERSFPSMLPTDGTADPATYCRRGSGARGRGHEWLRGREREAILRPPRLRVPYDPRFAAPLARLLMARCVRLARLAEPPSQDTWGTTGRHRRSQVVRGWNSRTTQTRGRSTPSIASGPAACFKGIAATQVAGGRALEGDSDGVTKAAVGFGHRRYRLPGRQPTPDFSLLGLLNLLCFIAPPARRNHVPRAIGALTN